MYRLFYLLPAILFIPAGIYLYHFFMRIASCFCTDTKKKSVRIPSIILAVIIWALSCNIWSVRAVILLYLVGISLVADLISVLVRALHKMQMKKKPLNAFSASEKKASRNHICSLIYRSGLIPILATLIIFALGYVNIKNVKETDYTIYTEKEIREEGYELAMIADLHFGTTMDAARLQEYCDQISAKEPDLILLCGDIVDESTTREELSQACKILGSMTSEYGVFYVYGNHDKSTYSVHPNYTEEELDQELLSNGIHILADQVYTVNDEFTIIGRKDASFLRTSTRMDAKSLIEQADSEDFILLLDHQPVELDENAALSFDLMLSGHTHGGQIWPVGPISDLFGINEMNYGYRKINQMQVIVTSGIAGWGYPIRISGQSEYVMIHVTSK